MRRQKTGDVRLTDIFLSYARSDTARIEPSSPPLELRGWSVWWDTAIIAGRIWEREIGKALDTSRCVIVAWSVASLESDRVWTEADEGKRRCILVPALIDRVAIPLAFRKIHAASLMDLRGEARSPQLEDLFRAVGSVLGTPAPTSKVPNPGAAKINSNDNLPYVWIPPGKFMMGCSPGDSECNDNEKPPHQVEISCGFG